MGRSLPAGALGTTLSLALGVLIAPATPALAETSTAPREVTVIPQDAATVRAHESVYFAGKTGFLHSHNQGSGYLWTRYDTGETVVVTELAGMGWTNVMRAGDDSVVLINQVPNLPAPGKVTVFNFATRTWQQWAIPTGYLFMGAYGQSMVVAPNGATGPALRLERRTFDTDGNQTGTENLTGIPTGAVYAGRALATDDGVMVVPYKTDLYRNLLLDVASGSLVDIPGAIGSNLPWRVSGDVVAWANLTGTYHVHSRAALLAGTAGTALQVQPSATLRVAVVGGNLIGANDQGANTKNLYPAVSVPIGGGDSTTLLPQTDYGLTAVVQGPDGTALVVGGTGPADWSVHRYTAEPGKAPTDRTVLAVKDPQHNAGLTYDRGLIRHVQTQVNPTDGTTRFVVFNHTQVPDDGVGPAGAMLPANTAPCTTGVECLRLVDGTWSGAMYLVSGTTDTIRSYQATNTSIVTMILPSTGGRIVDAGDLYSIVADAAAGKQYVVLTGGTQIVRTGPVTGAALWYDTLWTAGGPGSLQSERLTNPGTVVNVSTGADCKATEVQASARWIYWACGTDGPAGVYDRTLKRNLRVPSGPATLGDGFLVRHDTGTGSLRLSDFHDGTLHDPVKLADLPAGTPADSRGISWAVDKHGSGVAYVDADNAVHVLDSGVPSTAAGVATAGGNDWSYPRATDSMRYWSQTIQPTRPLWSWEVTITRKTSGEVVSRSSGGPSRTDLHAVWDGRLASGQPAVNGTYLWKLTGTTTEGEPSATVGTGTLRVACGTFSFRSVSCYGGPNLLAVKSNNEGHWYGEPYGAEPAGRLVDNGYTESWCLSCVDGTKASAIVPFGDLNGDGMPDLLVRDGVGYLRAYLGIGQPHYSSQTAKSIVLGKGWLTYRLLLAPGDLNRDGRDDLVGVDTTGKLWLYTSTGTGGFTARVQIGSGWGIYPKVIGVGDLNGDGNGELLAVDSTGGLYRYFGDGKGHLTARVKIGTGWNIYNTLVPIGDLNQDNRNDLIGRDANGVLWLYAGRGDGTFAARVQKATGFNAYKAIF
ncbi:VCBS repeat protein [Micromonospora kangleipakensis]|uniref:VCBS repeat protein n=1 Tax=Micromonospora kangleipakensis TaxID=1077942 RepID=A0A4V6MGQ8_9ACTN|nr:VCBS repeat-containing protein [Micromonospora kangleipakensis]RZU72246.1 VCBS repeat protein [Micromonospora kangleipakensis]